MQNQTRNSERCHNLYTRLRGLKDLLAQYNSVYQNACSKGIQEDAFTPCAKLKTKIQKEIATFQNTNLPKIHLLKRIAALPDDQNGEYKLKLRQIIKKIESKDSIKAALALDPDCELPKTGDIYRKLLELSDEQLSEIGKEMKDPAIIIVPNKSFFKLAKAVDNASYPQRRQDVDINRKIKDAPAPGKAQVCIIDMTTELSLVFGQFEISDRADSTRELAEDAMRMHNFRLPGPREYITALFQSLKSGDSSKIIDMHNDGQADSITLIDSKLSEGVRQIIGGVYIKSMGKPAFLYFPDNQETASLRARPVFDLIT